MTKEQLIRDLCSVEFRSKSETRQLVNDFVNSLIKKFNKLPYNVSTWKKVGINRGYYQYFRDEIIQELRDKIVRGFINKFCIPTIKGVQLDPEKHLGPDELQKNQEMINWLRDNIK